MGVKRTGAYPLKTTGTSGTVKCTSRGWRFHLEKEGGTHQAQVTRQVSSAVRTRSQASMCWSSAQNRTRANIAYLAAILLSGGLWTTQIFLGTETPSRRKLPHPKKEVYKVRLRKIFSKFRSKVQLNTNSNRELKRTPKKMLVLALCHGQQPV